MAVGVKAQTISGLLIDEQHKPLPYANVILQTVDSVYLAGTMTGLDGKFELALHEKAKLINFSYVGYTTVVQEISKNELGTIQLFPDAQLLGEVVVKAYLPKTQAKGDAMVTTVSGTVLEKAGTAENLLDKIPNVTAQDGAVTVFGRGTPEIYINGRKVRDNTELDRLESDNIKSVEVINNPGARYDASVTSVIRIITKKAQGEGFGFNNRTYASYNEKWTGLEQLDMNYRTGGFDFGGMVRYWNTYRIEDKVQNKYTYLDKEWREDIHSVGENLMERLGTQLSVNYTFNPNHSIGVRHDFTRSPDTNANWTTDDDIHRDNQLEEREHTTMGAYAQNHRHTLNAYYAGKVNDWNIDFNVDGMWYKGHESDWNNSAYQLIGQDEQTQFVNSTVRNTHKLYATKLVLTHPLAGGSLSFGGEYSYSKRTNLYTNPQGIVADDDSRTEEGIASAFVEYGRQIGKVSLQAGVRYEHVTFDYYIRNVYRKDLSRGTGDFFPSLALSFPLGKVQMQLGYAKDIQRPNFGELSGEVTYNNRYTYQTGNPLLLPMTTDNISLNAIYRWASLSVGYQHIKNKVFYSSAPYSEEKPDVMLLSLTNHPSYDFCFASLTLSPKIGFWSPQLSGQFTKQWIEIETHEGVVSANKPIFSLVWRNDFKLPQGFIFNASLNYQTKGHYENAYLHLNTWKMDFSLQKSFLKNRLNVQLSAKNPFQTYQNNSFVAHFGKMQTWYQDFNNSQYSYTLNIRYKFNATKSKYKGKGAGDSQKARM